MGGNGALGRVRDPSERRWLVESWRYRNGYDAEVLGGACVLGGGCFLYGRGLRG